MQGERDESGIEMEALLRASLRAAPPEGLERRVLARVRAAKAGARPHTWWLALRGAGVSIALALLMIAASLRWYGPRSNAKPVPAKPYAVSSKAPLELPGDLPNIEQPLQPVESPMRRHGPEHAKRLYVPDRASGRGYRVPGGPEPGQVATNSLDAVGMDARTLVAQDAPGHALPRLQDTSVPGVAPPAFPQNETPGRRLPQLTMAAVPGHALPAFLANIPDGDRP